MKILSINAEHTKDNRNVSFVIDIPPSQEVINEANSQAELDKVGFQFRINNTILEVQGTVDFINGMVQTIERYIAEAEEKLKADAEQASLKHKEMLEKLSKKIDLPINYEKSPVSELIEKAKEAFKGV